MTTRLSSAPPPFRRGSALLMAVVALTVVAAVTAAVTWQCLAARHLLDRRQNELQAGSLARAGVELAAARLLTDPAGYQGETVEPVPGSEVRIEVRAESGKTDVFRVTGTAHFPRDGRGTAGRSVTRTFRRTSRGDQVRLEAVKE